MSELIDEQKRYYAARAPEYDDWWYRRGRYVMEPVGLAGWQADVAEVDAALEAFAPRGRVLELAAGTGIWTRKLLRLAERVVAVDANAETLALNTPDAELIEADVFEWKPAERFDVVFFGFWLSHVPEARFDAFWLTVRDALAPGGRVFLVDNAAGGESTHGRPSGEETELRTLADGREFEIVKLRRTADELGARVAPLGFELDLRLTANGNFLYGFGS
jgi:demethylmenaquinone methyltransferase/2-methoxy-6-polyprenyl-1,4-benzoquinol methylase